jgi:serine/threonine protein kinase
MSEETARHHNANPSALPAGTRLGEFELLSLLGIGGFGIVYLAFDHALEREVAVKEYMPASLAGRTETMFVSIRSQSDAETFALGLKSFVNEARLLARFDHPSLLKVHRFWEGNGTAYMAMPVLRGQTVKEVRLAMSEPPSEAWLRSVLNPLLGAIEKLHSEGVYHRDIAPDNIQIEPDGRPVLLDFGAARRVLSDKSQALTAILKPAYAPIEQYAEAGSVKQGPWTDIYALGATLHFLLLGRPPPPATARAVHDDASALTTLALPGCSENFLHIVDWMLAPRPADRPQSVAALREVLDGRAPTPLRRNAAQQPASDWDRTVILPSTHASATTMVVPPTHQQTVAPGQQTTLVMSSSTTVAPQAAMTTGRPDEQTVRVARPGPLADMAAAPVSLPAATAAGGGSKRWMIGAGVGALVLVAVAVLALKGKPAGSSAAADMAAASAPAAQDAASAALAAAPAASRAESAVTTVVVAPAAAVASAPVAAAEVLATAAAVPAAKTAPTPNAAAAKATAGKPARTAAPAVVATSAPVVVAAAPAPEPVKARVEPAPAPAPAPVPVVEAPKAAPTNPEAVCGGRNPLLYFVCMEKECLRTEQMGHADCKKWRRSAVRQE